MGHKAYKLCQLFINKHKEECYAVSIITNILTKDFS